MTKDEVVMLGIASQRAKDMFSMLCHENTQTDPDKRAAQTLRFEKVRVEMHEAMNQHLKALSLLGNLD